MDRRRFLSQLFIGCPAAVVAEKLGLIDRMKSYFFAPAGGWKKQGELYVATDWGIRAIGRQLAIALQLEAVKKQIPIIYSDDMALLDVLEEAVLVVPVAFRPPLKAFRSCDTIQTK